MLAIHQVTKVGNTFPSYYISIVKGSLPLARSHLGDSGRMKYNKDKRAAGVESTSINILQFRIPAQDRIPTRRPPINQDISYVSLHYGLEPMWKIQDFLSLRFYVKSISGILEVQNLPF